MKIFVMSLKRSTDRRNRITTTLGDANIKFEFFDAIDASTPNFKYSNKRAPDQTLLRFGYALIESELACFASHYSLWQKCVALNEPILVFEDNCDLTELFQETQPLFDQLINKYHFIKLFSMFKKRYSTIEEINSTSEIVYYHERTCGLQSYLISPHAAKQFIKNANQFIDPVDNYMEKPWRHGISTYSFKPDLVTRAKIKSTIGSNRKIKAKLSIWHKAIIEIFRAYEEIRYKIKNLLIIIESNKR
ncbi:glycosyltransferase family 25 protein [Psychromonas antarctica]|uniref:glycosyltransferase family 25 protein n=1 Tax=Psychromonas antarctica TaxID=67573 RepID=UPI001EE839C2|nr:glycosyltransferase family 25 protein [Psychromonas antarctica]MCG6202593.1 glycosyltransferase family 25 protein [Psychromonas antarctica]